MNSVFQPLLRRCILIFLDDILIYSTSLESHVVDLKSVLELMRVHKLFA